MEIETFEVDVHDILGQVAIFGRKTENVSSEPAVFGEGTM